MLHEAPDDFNALYACLLVENGGKIIFQAFALNALPTEYPLPVLYSTIGR